MVNLSKATMQVGVVSAFITIVSKSLSSSILKYSTCIRNSVINIHLQNAFISESFLKHLLKCLLSRWLLLYLCFLFIVGKLHISVTLRTCHDLLTFHPGSFLDGPFCIHQSKGCTVVQGVSRDTEEHL